MQDRPRHARSSSPSARARAGQRRRRSRCASPSTAAGIRTGAIRVNRACRPRSTWRLPPGYAAGDIAWPAPRALPAGPLVNYGYEGEVLPPGARDASPRRHAGHRGDARRARRLAGVQGNVHSRRRRPDARAAGGRSCRRRSRWHARNRSDARRAAATHRLRGWRASATASGPVVYAAVDARRMRADPGRLQFFAERRAPDRAVGAAAGDATATATWALKLAGVARAERRFRASAGRASAPSTAFEAKAASCARSRSTFRSPARRRPVRSPCEAAATEISRAFAGRRPSLSLPLALAFAFGGGLLLNLMPCVFPVLSLKALASQSAPATTGVRCAARASRSRRASSSRSRCSAPRSSALRAGGRATRLGLPAAVARRGHRPRAAVLRDGAQPVGRVRIRLAAAVALASWSHANRT